MILTTALNTQDPNFTTNHTHHRELGKRLTDMLETVRQGGGEALRQREHQRGKWSVRERIAALLDPGTHFLELSPLCALNLYPGLTIPAGGLITGVGQVHARPCMIIANDQTVKGGCYFPITVKKQLRAMSIAYANRLPCLYLVDSGGAYLPLQHDLFADGDGFGRIFYMQARLNAAGIPQFASIHGHCTAGGAYIPAMSQQTVMVQNQGRIFLAGPPLVEAAIGESLSAEELGGWQVHGTASGVVDALAAHDEEACAVLRSWVQLLPAFQGFATFPATQDIPPPRYPMEDLLGLLPTDLKNPFDPRELLARILDGSQWLPFKDAYGPTLVTGWGKMGGMPVGVLANHGILHTESAQKGSHFIDLCTRSHTPLLFIQNVAGFMVGQEAERRGIAKEGAKMVQRVALAQVPKITLIIGGSHGAGNYAMCGRAYGGDFLFSWPQARTSIMGAKEASFVLKSIHKKSSSASQPFHEKQFAEDFERHAQSYYGSARLWDDGMIHPLETRKTLILALASTVGKRRPHAQAHCITRM